MQQRASTNTRRRGFVIVLEGSVLLEIEGKTPQTFKAGQAFQRVSSQLSQGSKYAVEASFAVGTQDMKLHS